MSFFPSKPGATSLRDVFMMFPDRAKFLLEYHEAVMRGPSAFTVAERELIFAFGSGVNACEFCHNTHKYTAAAFGVDEDLFEKLFDDIDAAPIDDKLKPVLKYVRKLTKEPSKMTRKDADAIFEAGWDERAFFDAVTVCALHNLMNRMVDGTGVDVGEDQWRASADRLSTIGYGGSAKTLPKAQDTAE